MKRSGIYKSDQQKRHIDRGLLFWPGGLKGYNTILWKFTCYDLWVFQNFQDKPNFSGVFKKAFPQSPCLFFLEQTLIDRWTFCSRCWDIYPAHCTGLELPRNKFCYILHPKYKSFSCCPIISTSASLYFNEIRVTYVIFDVLKEADWMLFLSFRRQILLRADYCIFYGNISIDVSKKVYLISCNLTRKIAVCFLACYLFWLIKLSLCRAPATK